MNDIKTNIRMSFNPQIAKEIGVEEAIMYSNIEFWCDTNKKHNKHYHDKYYWMYNSISAFTEFFPFWTEKQLLRILNNLKKNKYIISGNYNKLPFDRTLWYAIPKQYYSSICPNGQIEVPKRSNRSAQTVTAIPDSKPDNKPDNKDISINELYNSIYDLYSEKINSKSRLTNSAKKKIETRLKEYSPEDLKRAIMNFSRSTWWTQHNAHRGVAWFFHTEDRIDQFLNLEPEDKKEKLNL